MAQNFIACDREQPFLLPPDVRERLPEDHAVADRETSRFTRPIARTATAARPMSRR
jgi:hypothetical protein